MDSLKSNKEIEDPGIQSACQSCGMPLNVESVLGTDQHGKKITEYCMYCYEGGSFKQPDITLDEMVEICVPFLVQDGMEEQTARNVMKGSLPQLKRWSQQE